MSERERPAWMVPVKYNDDRFAETKPPTPLPGQQSLFGDDAADGGEERSGRDVEELLRRPDREERSDYECSDTTPVNYKKGPHDEEFGVEETEFDAGAENAPLQYERGPHDEEFGVEDDLLPLDDEPEFPED